MVNHSNEQIWGCSLAGLEPPITLEGGIMDHGVAGSPGFGESEDSL